MRLTASTVQLFVEFLKTLCFVAYLVLKQLKANLQIFLFKLNDVAKHFEKVHMPWVAVSKRHNWINKCLKLDSNFLAEKSST